MRKSKPSYRYEKGEAVKHPTYCYGCRSKLARDRVTMKIGSKIRDLCRDCIQHYMQ